MPPLARLALTLVALLPAIFAIDVSYASNCEKIDIGDVSEGKTHDLPEITLPFGSSGRVDIPDGCQARGIGYACGERVVACNSNQDGPKPMITSDRYRRSPVQVICAPGDGCYPGGAEVYITLYCSPYCLPQ